MFAKPSQATNVSTATCSSRKRQYVHPGETFRPGNARLRTRVANELKMGHRVIVSQAVKRYRDLVDAEALAIKTMFICTD